MNNEDENKSAEDETSASESTDRNENAESGEDDYKRDESNRGERPDNLRQRSEWFQKRTGGR